MDDRDWSWMGGSAPAAPTYPEVVAWRVEKPDGRWAEGRIRSLPVGREVRFVVGGPGREDDVLYTVVCADVAELASHLAGIRQSFEGKGWTLVSDSPPQ